MDKVKFFCFDRRCSGHGVEDMLYTIKKGKELLVEY